MSNTTNATPAPRETMRLQAPGAPTLALQLQRAAANIADVIYVHGSTFGACLSVFFPLDGGSWADALCEAGFNVWGFDFAGYGDSDRYRQNDDAAAGGMACAVPQLQRVVDAVRTRNDGRPVLLLAHSWGGSVAAHYASTYSDIGALVLFAPIVMRENAAAASGYVPAAAGSASHYALTLWAQYRRFIQDVPAGSAQPFDEAPFQAWGEAFLSTDPDAHRRSPPAVMTPAGPQADVRALWSGQALYDAARIAVPTLLVRGEWDSACSQADAQRLLDALGSAQKSCEVIAAATHLMHLESGRGLLYNAVNAFFSRSAR
jgi:alpha-beta hydrolase superfamily lysophospholipase